MKKTSSVLKMWNKEMHGREQELIPLGTISLTATNLSENELVHTLKLVQRVIENTSDFLQGNDSKRGQIAQQIRRNSRFYLIHIERDTLKLELGSFTKQTSLLEQPHSLELFIDLFEHLKHIKNGHDFLYLYNLRIFNAVKLLLSDLMTHYDKIFWQTEMGHRQLILNQSELVQLRSKLRFQVKYYEEQPLTFRGKIIGVNHQTKTLTLQTEIGTRSVYVIDPYFKNLALTTQKNVRLNTQKIVYQLSNDEEVTLYTLLSVNAIHKLH